MVIKIEVIGAEKKIIELDENEITVREILKKLNLLSTEFVIIKNNMVVTEDEIVRNGDIVKLYPVKSGG
ncbi:MAG: MoaD/ThiS family protein [Thermoprotei archaeon]